MTRQRRPGGRFHPPVAGDERDPEELRGGDVGGVVPAQVVAELPPAPQERRARLGPHDHLAEPPNGALSGLARQLPAERATADHAEGLDAQVLGAAQRFPRMARRAASAIGPDPQRASARTEASTTTSSLTAAPAPAVEFCRGVAGLDREPADVGCGVVEQRCIGGDRGLGERSDVLEHRERRSAVDRAAAGRRSRRSPTS